MVTIPIPLQSDISLDGACNVDDIGSGTANKMEGGEGNGIISDEYHTSKQGHNQKAHYQHQQEKHEIPSAGAGSLTRVAVYLEYLANQVLRDRAGWTILDENLNISLTQVKSLVDGFNNWCETQKTVF